MLRYSSKIATTQARQFCSAAARYQSQVTPAQQPQERLHNELAKELISGAPKEIVVERTARIYKPAKSATQSGSWGSRDWKIDFDVLGKANRWENDLIGYQGSGDYLQALELKFHTKEDAIRFAQGQGYDYYVQEPKARSFTPKQYAENFIHSKGPLKNIRTK